MEAATVTRKGQVTIPQALRQYLFGRGARSSSPWLAIIWKCGSFTLRHRRQRVALAC
jgi:hypothetical protein